VHAVAERFLKTIKDECLSKMVFFGESNMRRVRRALPVGGCLKARESGGRRGGADRV
jgi:hypothetical protein